MQMTAKDIEGKPLFWIAVNGCSCAMFPAPLRFPFVVRPIPQYVIGFETVEEALRAQEMCLEYSMDALRPVIVSWKFRANVAFVKMSNPEPMTDGPTTWMEE